MRSVILLGFGLIHNCRNHVCCGALLHAISCSSGVACIFRIIISGILQSGHDAFYGSKAEARIFPF